MANLPMASLPMAGLPMASLPMAEANKTGPEEQASESTQLVGLQPCYLNHDSINSMTQTMNIIRKTIESGVQSAAHHLLSSRVSIDTEYLFISSH